MTQKHKVLVLEPIHRRALSVLTGSAEVVFAAQHDEEHLKALARDVDGLVKRDRGFIGEAIMTEAPRLRVIGRHGVGVESIDVEAATRLGIYVVNTPLANVEAVAEHVIGMMIVLSKKMLISDRDFRRGQWDVRYAYIGQELGGRSLGLVGFGKIGQRVAALARAFSMRIFYHDVLEHREAARAASAQRLPFDELLSKCDCISLHVPATTETAKMIGRREFALMRPGTLFFNTARGQVVDEGALLEALQKGRIAGAGLDVFEAEPTAESNPLLHLDNVVVTPHMAAHTDEALHAMAMVVSDVLNVLEGRPPLYPVNAPENPRRIP